METEQPPKKPPQPGTHDIAQDVDPVKMELYLQEVRDRQNYSLALLAAIVAAAAGAAAWAAMTVWSEKEYALLAIGIGFLVGFSVRLAGRGIDKPFGVIGALFAFLGVVAGKIGTMVVLLSQKLDISIGQALRILNADIVMNFLKETFSVIDILFYIAAIFVGYKYAFKPIPAEDLLKLQKNA